jgi:hypothetical protein
VDNVGVIRDVMQNPDSDLDLIDKLVKSKAQPAKTPLEIRYDDRYIKECFRLIANSQLPLSSLHIRDTFDHYSHTFRKYAEEKFYSGIKNLPGLV